MKVGRCPGPTTPRELPELVELSGRLRDVLLLIHDQGHRCADDVCLALVDDQRGIALARLLDGVSPWGRTAGPTALESLALPATLRSLADEIPLCLGHERMELQLLPTECRGGVDVLGDRSEPDAEVLHGPDPGPQDSAGTADAIEPVDHDHVDEALPSGFFEPQHAGAADGHPRHSVVPEDQLRSEAPSRPAVSPFTAGKAPEL
jgi:hypothetical protein